MDTNLLLSIIVPVYNAEKYISVCLDSILEQDIEKCRYEIICVNDGSTDFSPSILQEYEQKYNNIRLLTISNSGVAAARNTGLHASQGQYVWFIDADDWIARNCLGAILRAIIDLHPCVIQLQYDYIKAQWRINECLGAALHSDQVSCSLHEIDILHYDGAWSSVIERSFLTRHNHEFIVGLNYGEDILFMRELFDIMRIEAAQSKSVLQIAHCLGDIFYYYRQHDNSAMNTHWTKNRSKYMKALLDMAHINQERMNDSSKPDWYREQYTDLFYHRMYTYMMHWLPAECSDLKKHLKQLKAENLYPCPAPSKRIMIELTKAESPVARIKNLYRYYAFRLSWLYPLYHYQMAKRYQKSVMKAHD